jgi:hypothetical protein
MNCPDRATGMNECDLRWFLFSSPGEGYKPTFEGVLKQALRIYRKQRSQAEHGGMQFAHLVQRSEWAHTLGEHTGDGPTIRLTLLRVRTLSVLEILFCSVRTPLQRLDCLEQRRP